MLEITPILTWLLGYASKKTLDNAGDLGLRKLKKQLKAKSLLNSAEVLETVLDGLDLQLFEKQPIPGLEAEVITSDAQHLLELYQKTLDAPYLTKALETKRYALLSMLLSSAISASFFDASIHVPQQRPKRAQEALERTSNEILQLYSESVSEIYDRKYPADLYPELKIWLCLNAANILKNHSNDLFAIASGTSESRFEVLISSETALQTDKHFYLKRPATPLRLLRNLPETDAAVLQLYQDASQLLDQAMRHATATKQAVSTGVISAKTFLQHHLLRLAIKRTQQLGSAAAKSLVSFQRDMLLEKLQQSVRELFEILAETIRLFACHPEETVYDKRLLQIHFGSLLLIMDALLPKGDATTQKVSQAYDALAESLYNKKHRESTYLAKAFQQLDPSFQSNGARLLHELLPKILAKRPTWEERGSVSEDLLSASEVLQSLQRHFVADRALKLAVKKSGTRKPRRMR